MNERLDPFTNHTLPPVINIDQIVDPSRTVVFADATLDLYHGHLWNQNSFTYRHNGKKDSNFAFADGHVESAQTRTNIDAISNNHYPQGEPDGYDDAIPPKKFIYDPRGDEIGYPGWDYSVYGM